MAVYVMKMSVSLGYYKQRKVSLYKQPPRQSPL